MHARQSPSRQCWRQLHLAGFASPPVRAARRQLQRLRRRGQTLNCSRPARSLYRRVPSTLSPPWARWCRAPAPMCPWRIVSRQARPAEQRRPQLHRRRTAHPRHGTETTRRSTPQLLQLHRISSHQLARDSKMSLVWWRCRVPIVARWRRTSTPAGRVHTRDDDVASPRYSASRSVNQQRLRHEETE